MSGFKSDKYKARRSAWSRFLKIKCKECGNFLFYYQKDGPGPLKRCYLDRMVDYEPEFNTKGYVYCRCGECLGFNEPYKKENNRPAIRMASQSVVHELIPSGEVSNQ